MNPAPLYCTDHGDHSTLGIRSGDGLSASTVFVSAAVAVGVLVVMVAMVVAVPTAR